MHISYKNYITNYQHVYFTYRKTNKHTHIHTVSIFTVEVVNSVRRETTTIKKRGYQQRHSNCNMNERNPEQDGSTR